MVPEFLQDDADSVDVANDAFEPLLLILSFHRNNFFEGYFNLIPFL